MNLIQVTTMKTLKTALYALGLTAVALTFGATSAQAADYNPPRVYGCPTGAEIRLLGSTQYCVFTNTNGEGVLNAYAARYQANEATAQAVCRASHPQAVSLGYTPISFDSPSDNFIISWTNSGWTSIPAKQFNSGILELRCGLPTNASNNRGNNFPGSNVNGTCSPDRSVVDRGQTVRWRVYPNGGTGSYSYAWSGSEGLYGDSSRMDITYDFSGTKYAYVTLYDTNGYSSYLNCGSVTVRETDYYNDNYYDYSYNNSRDRYNFGTARCEVSPRYVLTGATVEFTAYTDYAGGDLEYYWAGADTNGRGSRFTTSFSSAGTKDIVLTVRNQYRTSRVNCPSVTVASRPAQTYVAPVTTYVAPTVTRTVATAAATGKLDAVCVPGVNQAEIGQEVNWTVQPTGGTGKYSYAWTGTDGVNGSTSQITTSYNEGGTKDMFVTVTSGTQSIVRNCSLAVLDGDGTNPVARSGNRNLAGAAALSIDLSRVPAWLWLLLVVIILAGVNVFQWYQKNKDLMTK
jgi:hypothetical protein